MDKQDTCEMDDFVSATSHSRGDMVEVYKNETRIVWLQDPNQRSASGKKVANIYVENSKKISQKQQKTKVSWQLTSHGTYERKLINVDETLETATGNLALPAQDSNCCGDAGYLMNSQKSNAILGSQMQQDL